MPICFIRSIQCEQGILRISDPSTVLNRITTNLYFFIRFRNCFVPLKKPLTIRHHLQRLASLILRQQVHYSGSLGVLRTDWVSRHTGSVVIEPRRDNLMVSLNNHSRVLRRNITLLCVAHQLMQQVLRQRMVSQEILRQNILGQHCLGQHWFVVRLY